MDVRAVFHGMPNVLIIACPPIAVERHPFGTLRIWYAGKNNVRFCAFPTKFPLTAGASPLSVRVSYLESLGGLDVPQQFEYVICCLSIDVNLCRFHHILMLHSIEQSLFYYTQ